MTDQTATERLRQLLDERGVEWTENDGEHVKETCWPYMGELMATFVEYDNGTTRFACDTWCFTPEQAVDATLGTIPRPNPTWERWLKSLKHDEVKTVGDAVEQLMYEAIEFGGDMGPNGNTYNGIDEGDVLTADFINEWVARFEATLDCDECLRADASHKELRGLQVENEKLRELLSIMAYCNQFSRDCDGCSLNGAAGIITGRAGCDTLLDRMRELGVGQ